MKTGSIKILDKLNGKNYGIDVNIKAPIHTQVHLISIIKPLLDGTICAFHHHDSSELDETVCRLNKQMNLPQKQIRDILLDRTFSVLGPRNLIQPYRKGVKWNPGDDAFQCFNIHIEPQQQSNHWIIEGKIYTIDYLG